MYVIVLTYAHYWVTISENVMYYDFIISRNGYYKICYIKIEVNYAILFC
jgi:hypothetical protein